MNNIDIKTLIDELRCGRELEFVWKKKTYSIHCKYPKMWFLTSVDADITFEAKSVDILLNHMYFGDKRFLDIFSDVTDAILY